MHWSTSFIAMAIAEASAGQNVVIEPITRDTFMYFTLVDTVLSAYRLPVQSNKPDSWLRAEAERKDHEWYGNSFPDTFDLEDALATIDTATGLWAIASAKSWCIRHPEPSFPHLIQRLACKRKMGLTGTADLIIWDRVATGDLQFYGHGGAIEEDLFTIAGRASWILNEITGEEFAEVHASLTKEQARQLNEDWMAYIRRLD